MLLALFVVLLIQQIRATAAYTRAMNSIAEAARKGENMTVQVANFNSNQPAIDGNSTIFRYQILTGQDISPGKYVSYLLVLLISALIFFCICLPQKAKKLSRKLALMHEENETLQEMLYAFEALKKNSTGARAEGVPDADTREDPGIAVQYPTGSGSAIARRHCCIHGLE